jgi:Kef-type K+ transport system membrane component KefB
VTDHLQAIITVLSLVNPFMCAAIFVQIEAGKSPGAQLGSATRVALAVFVILTVAALVGVKVLHLFGVSLDAFMVAGGGVLAWLGFSMLRGSPPGPPAAATPNANSSLTPLILFAASPGTITGIITLSVAHGKSGIPVTALLAVAVATSVMWLSITVPLLLGTAVGLLFGYQPVAAIVLGSLLASHTLLAAPIIVRLGATRLEPVTITFGATVFSDTLSLIVFAICVPIYQSGFSVSGLVVQLIEIAIFVPLILFGLSRLGAYILKKAEDDEDAYFILMLAIVAVAGLLAQSINLPGIVGAFLAGLAVIAAVHDKPAKEKLEFFGNSFFIPIFFIVTGFLIDPVTFFQSITTNFPLVSGVIGALLVGKWIAAQTVGRAFAYTPAARMTMWSLTLPQVNA